LLSSAIGVSRSPALSDASISLDICERVRRGLFGRRAVGTRIVSFA